MKCLLSSLYAPRRVIIGGVPKALRGWHSHACQPAGAAEGPGRCRGIAAVTLPPECQLPYQCLLRDPLLSLTHVLFCFLGYHKL